MKLDIAIIGAAALVSGAVFVGCTAGSNGGGRARDGSIDPADAAGDAGERADAYVEARCGDLYCTEPTETCETCPLDCGECPTCDAAPSCTGATAVPTETQPVASCNNEVEGGDIRTNFACGDGIGVEPGASTCADPQLRIRIREISIDRGNLDLERNLFCVISTEDGQHSELLLTTPRSVAGGGATSRVNMRLSEGLMWGQGDLYRSISNVTITYACFLSSDNAAAQAVLDDIADRASEVSEHAGEYGYVFGAISVIGSIIGSSLGAVADDQILDVQQTISADALLDLTNGRTWEIRERHGNQLLSGASDIRLTVESWGCADVRSTLD